MNYVNRISSPSEEQQDDNNDVVLSNIDEHTTLDSDSIKQSNSSMESDENMCKKEMKEFIRKILQEKIQNDEHLKHELNELVEEKVAKFKINQ
jgi:hypothetical protein